MESMKRADQFGELIIKFYINYFIGCYPIINIIACSVSIGYSLYIYDEIKVDSLYAPYKLV